MGGIVGKRRRARRVTRKQIVLLSGGAGACAVGTAAWTGDLRYVLEFLSWLLRTMATLGASAG